VLPGDCESCDGRKPLLMARSIPRRPPPSAELDSAADFCDVPGLTCRIDPSNLGGPSLCEKFWLALLSQNIFGMLNQRDEALMLAENDCCATVCGGEGPLLLPPGKNSAARIGLLRVMPDPYDAVNRDQNDHTISRSGMGKPIAPHDLDGKAERDGLRNVGGGKRSINTSTSQQRPGSTTSQYNQGEDASTRPTLIHCRAGNALTV